MSHSYVTIDEFQTRQPQPQEASPPIVSLMRMYVDQNTPTGTPGAGERYSMCRFKATSGGMKVLARAFLTAPVGTQVLVAFFTSPVGTFNSTLVRAAIICTASRPVLDIRYNLSTHNQQVTYDGETWENRIQYDSCSGAALTGGDSSIVNPYALSRQSSGILDSAKLSAVNAGTSPNSIPIADYNNQPI